jgi:hypothetical protein
MVSSLKRRLSFGVLPTLISWIWEADNISSLRVAVASIWARAVAAANTQSLEAENSICTTELQDLSWQNTLWLGVRQL